MYSTIVRIVVNIRSHYCGKLANCRQLSENTVENSRRVFFDRLRGGTWWLTGSKPLTTKTTTCLIRTTPLIFANTYTIKERMVIRQSKFRNALWPGHCKSALPSLKCCVDSFVWHSLEVFNVEIWNRIENRTHEWYITASVTLWPEGGDDSCVTVALFIVWRMLMLKYETEREEDSRHRNNKHDFNCEGGNDNFVTVALFKFMF